MTVSNKTTHKAGIRLPFTRIAFASLALILSIMMMSCSAKIARTASEDILVTPEWIAGFDGEISILDTGRSADDYFAGHIPGAVAVNRELVWDTVGGLAGMLPDPEAVAQDLAELGISNDVPVVIYDGGNSLWASRFFWALEYIGHSKVHLLDGGFAAWSSSRLEISTEASVPSQGELTANVQSDLIADKEYIIENLDSDKIQIIDTRSAGEFDGSDVRADRGGHIPGSVNIEWRDNLSSDNKFLAADQLGSMYQVVLDDDSEAITLCQTGVRGAHSYVALRIAGYQKVRLYDGSWTDWGNDSEAPIEL